MPEKLSYSREKRRLKLSMPHEGKFLRAKCAVICWEALMAIEALSEKVVAMAEATRL